MRLEEIAVTPDLDAAHEEATAAIAQVERLTRVVDDLLMRRRTDPEAAQPEVALDTVIASLQREWQPAFEKARRSVRVHGQRGLVVKATPVALSQVLSTLLENSLVHGRGTVDVQARRSGPSVVVEVRDQGEGVSAALAPHIFERSVSSGTGTSTGLGLALARDLAERAAGGWTWWPPSRRPSRSSFPRPTSAGGVLARGPWLAERVGRLPVLQLRVLGLLRGRLQLLGVSRVLPGEDELAVGPEPEDGRQGNAHDGVDAHRGAGVHAKGVVGEVQPERGDDQADAVDDEEHHGLVVHRAVAPVAEGPHPVAHPRERRGGHAREDLGRREVALQRPVEEHVEPAEVDDEGDRSNDSELGQLAPEDVDESSDPVGKTQLLRGHTGHCIWPTCPDRALARVARRGQTDR